MDERARAGLTADIKRCRILSILDYSWVSSDTLSERIGRGWKPDSSLPAKSHLLWHCYALLRCIRLVAQYHMWEDPDNMKQKKSWSPVWIVIRLIKRVFLLISLPVELVISSIYVSRHAAQHPSLDIVFIRSSLMTYSGQSFSLLPNLCFPLPLQMPFRVLPLHQTLDSASSESHCG